VWESKTTAIQEARNLKTLSWDELLGILRVQEVHLQKQRPPTKEIFHYHLVWRDQLQKKRKEELF